MIEQSISHMCKSARAMGLSKAKWLRIEDHITVIYRESGPEFLISYLKDIRDAKVKQMNGEDDLGLSWHKVNRNGEPCGWQSELWNFRRHRTSIQVVSAMINSIELHNITKKQFNKWLDGVRRSEPVSSGMLVDKIYITDYHEKTLANQIAKQSFFQPEDITGVAIPIKTSRINLSRSKNDKSPSKIVETQLQAYLASIKSAPAFAGELELANLNWVKNNFPDIEIKDEEERRIIAEYVSQHNTEFNTYQYSYHSDGRLDDTFTMGPGSTGHRIGQIAFIQQSGGKLRTIANPNRYLQHTLRPYQAYLADMTYYQKTVCVRDQKSGINWAQDQLRKGKTLHSFDLSAATDTLDFEAFHYFAFEYLSEDSGLKQNFDFFTKAAQGNWYSPDLERAVAWRVGQPLGLAPSFAYLTLMNVSAGNYACRKLGLKPEDHFRVVGDDFVCTSDIADLYNEAIVSMGGITNPEKMLVSNKYAEFCSQMISANTSWPIKPKIRGIEEAYFVDIEKSTLSAMAQIGYPKKFTSMGEYLAEFSSSDLDNLPSIAGPKLRDYNTRKSVSEYLGVVAALTERLPDSREIVLGPSLQLSAQVASDLDPVCSNLLHHLDIDFLRRLAPVKVRVAEKRKVYDWKKDQYIEPQSPITRARNLYRALRKIDNSSEFHDDISLITGLKDPHNNNVSYEFYVLPDPTSGVSRHLLLVKDKELDTDSSVIHEVTKYLDVDKISSIFTYNTHESNEITRKLWGYSRVLFSKFEKDIYTEGASNLVLRHALDCIKRDNFSAFDREWVNSPVLRNNPLLHRISELQYTKAVESSWTIRQHPVENLYGCAELIALQALNHSRGIDTPLLSDFSVPGSDNVRSLIDSVVAINATTHGNISLPLSTNSSSPKQVRRKINRDNLSGPDL